MFSIALITSLGFCIFLFGMKLMELALFRLGGTKVISTLEHATKTPIHGLALGTAASAILQSSTAVTILSISFVNSRLIPFSRTLAIILGTNIGTCLTTELISLNILHLAKPLMIISAIAWIFTIIIIEYQMIPKLTNWNGAVQLRYTAIACFGFAALLEGISVMQSVGPRLMESEWFGLFIDNAGQSLLWGLLVGAALTALVHSSAAVIAMTMGIAASGAMPLEVSIAIVLGSNVGTCVTAAIAAIGSSLGGKLIALSHLLLNVFGALLFYPFIHLLADLANILASSISVQIAHIQTIFNVICSLLALPICYLPFLKKWD